MTINDTELENILKYLLQKNLKLSIKNKQYRKGKLILFKQKNYHIEITIKKNEDDIKRFEIPIPFNIEIWKEDGLIYFDYRLITLANNDKVIYNELKKLESDKAKHRFYDQILEIQIAEELNG